MPDMCLSEGVKKALIQRISKPRQGVADTLKFLRAKEIEISLLSNGPVPALVHKNLEYSGLCSIFGQVILRREMGEYLKPSPVSLLRIIGDDTTQKKRCWVVGDSAGDMKMALDAQKCTQHHIYPVAMGARSPAALYARENQYVVTVIDSLADLGAFCCEN